VVERSDTTGNFGIRKPDPGGVAETTATPPGSGLFAMLTGGIAPLNHRLMALILPGSKSLAALSYGVDSKHISTTSDTLEASGKLGL
jgi:hypothetical protein